MTVRRQVKPQALAWLCCLALAWHLSALACPALAEPPAEAEALWTFINQPPGFQSWGTWSALRELRRSHCGAAYGYFSRVFANDIALKAKGASLPPGSIIVREGQNMGSNTMAPNGQIKAYTVMYKVRGFNPKGNDWFWATYTGLGQARDSGVLTECIKCHQSAWQSDYLLGVDLK